MTDQLQVAETQVPSDLTIFNTDIIPVYTTPQGEQVVIGRELHKALGIQKKYVDWFPQMTSYGFSFSRDYYTFTETVHSPKRERTYEQINNLLKLDMAKHIAMIQRTEQGKAIRQKLIDLEKMVSQKQTQMSPLQMIHTMTAEMMKQDERLSLLETKVEEQITIDHGEQRRIQRAIGTGVYEEASDSERRSQLFRELHREIRDRFGVASYRDLKRKDLQLAIRYIEGWIPRREVTA